MSDFLPKLHVCLLICILAPTHLQADEDKSRIASKQTRPKIGLALSGGGARGAAHVGVLKVLEALHIPIDYIAGTSMGAVIGGLHASGMSADEIGNELERMDWEGLFQDEQARQDRSMRRKAEEGLYLTKAKPGVKDGEITLASAIVQGQKFDLELKRMTLRVYGINDFDQLPIPFRAIATDIVTGGQVVIKNGDLARAMRASMAVPGAFAGVEQERKLLVDGGIVNNLPVDIVRGMGAGIVIAVDISAQLYSKEELNSPVSILDQLTTILTRKNTEQQIASLKERDLLIAPDLGDLGSVDFDRVKEAVAIGRAATEKLRERLAPLGVSAGEYNTIISERTLRQPFFAIGYITLEHDSDLDDEVIRKQLAMEPGAFLDLDQLERGIGRIYDLELFESVTYELITEDGITGLVIHAREKSWGTDFLQFGLELSGDLSGGDSFFNLAATYTHMPMNSLNGEWRTLVRIGEEPALITEWYQPLDTNLGNFYKLEAGYRTDRFKLFQGSSAITEYESTTYGLGLTIGRNLGNWRKFTLGYRRYLGEINLQTGIQALDDYRFDGGELVTGFHFDRMDSITFPRQGTIGELTWTQSREWLQADDDFDQIRFRMGMATSWEDNTLVGLVRYETTLNEDAPLQNQFHLGGLLNLSGLQRDQLTGQHDALLLLGYMRRLYRSQYLPTYAGLSLELGNVWQHRDEVSLRNSLVAGSLFLGADTPLGPFYFGYGRAEGSDDRFYLFLGQPWF